MDKKVLEYQYFHQQLRNLLEYLETLKKYYEEIINTIESLELCKQTNDFYVDLGNNIFARINLQEKKFLVNIGAGIFLEKSLEEALEILNKRKQDVEKEIQETNENIQILYDYLKKLETEIKNK
ncbi:MAG: prefoldin subunit alpha [Candidatus Aenigmatarchaeota archaeon]